MRLKQYINESNELDEVVDYIKKDCKPFLKELKHNVLLWRGIMGGRSIKDIKRKESRLKDRSPSDTPVEIHNHLNELFYNKFRWKARNGIFTTSNMRDVKKYGAPMMFFPIGEYKYVWSPKIEDLWTEIDENPDGFVVYDPDEYFNYEESYKWQQEYGEYGEGHWEYDGNEVDSNRRSNIIEDLDLEEDEFDEDLVMWIPDIDYESWIENEIENWVKERDAWFEYIVDSYTDKNLDRAIKSKNEIMFNCKEYYVVNEKYYTSLQNILKSL